jgi:translation initiation factor 2 beta subunit (eIF-2beta)/eIF-5
MISINKKFVNDPFYRYKMNKVDVSVKNKKTTINNLAEICKILKIEEKNLFKFLTNTLGTFGQDKNNNYIISGTFDSNKIQDVIYTFIDKYILCKNCQFPELCKENNIVICKACGASN